MSEIKAFKIIPAIQHYAWGGISYIPTWLHLDNNASRPYAEAWYGDHPIAPSQAMIGDRSIPLNQIIAEDSSHILGNESIEFYGSKMPFLLKILDVKDMLSLQLHPTKAAAMEGYQIENEMGIPLNAPNRNYKDQNHKPELLFALSDFWMLQGFATMEEIKDRLETLIPEFPITYSMDWRSLMQRILDLHLSEYSRYTQSLQKNLSTKNLEDKNLIFHWIHKALNTYPQEANPNDRGILIMLLLHVQYLKPGQVGYQAPGVIHAYLEGQNIELMANSDNVLRGGLTPKYIDPIELMKHLDTDTSGQCLIKPIHLMDDEVAFIVPVNDFWLKQYKVAKGTIKTIQFNTASIVLNREGVLQCIDIVLSKGESLLLPAYSILTIKSLEESEFFVSISSL